MTFQAQVEPRLLANPRVHLFAAAPILGSPTTPLSPLSVCVDPTSGGDPGVSWAALERQTLRPAEALEAGVGDALEVDGPEWLVLLRAGDHPHPRALERLAQAAVLASDADVITCDQDRLERGRRVDPTLRPGPSPDRWLALADAGSLVAVRRAAARALLDSLDARTGAREELALRLAGRDGARHAHVPLVLAHVHDAAPKLDSAVRDRAARSVLAAWDPAARVERTSSGARRIRRPVAGEPSVDVIVLFKDRPELLERCAGSVLSLTAWERLTLHLVDNGSTDASVPELLGRLRRDPRVSVHRDPRPFNFAALTNSAATRGGGELVAFLNNDTEVTDPDWLSVLIEEARRPQVGAVAPLLLYPDGRVQHAGAAIGLHGYAGHPFAGLSPDAVTPFGSATDAPRNWLAVTAACLVVERSKLEAVGGFDERFVVAGNDVDLGLRLTARGWRSQCVPYTSLVHDESRSRAGHSDAGDFERSELSYGAFRTVGDPFYHPALTLTRTDCSLRRGGEAPVP